MAIKQVTVGIARLIALAKYENVRYECTAVVEVEDGQTAEQAYEQGLAFCKEKVLAEVERLQK